MSTPNTVLVAAACVAVAGLGACSGSAPEANEPTTTTTTTTSTEAAVWDDRKRAAARQLGVQVLELYLTPGSQADWWANLEPVLSDGCNTVYEDAAPPSRSSAPVSITEQEARLVEDKDGKSADVHVQTNRGVYVVALSRNHIRETWKVDAFRPPTQHQSA